MLWWGFTKHERAAINKVLPHNLANVSAAGQPQGRGPRVDLRQHLAAEADAHLGVVRRTLLLCHRRYGITFCSIVRKHDFI